MYNLIKEDYIKKKIDIEDRELMALLRIFAQYMDMKLIQLSPFTVCKSVCYLKNYLQTFLNNRSAMGGYCLKLKMGIFWLHWKYTTTFLTYLLRKQCFWIQWHLTYHPISY